MNFNAGIIGCGNTAGGYDEKIRDNRVRTHAKAYQINSMTELDSAADINIERLNEFSDYWNMKNRFDNYIDMIKQRELDIVSICTPPVNRFDMIKTLVDNGIKLIVCEKPLTQNPEEAYSIYEYCKNKKVKLAVNYKRRWDPFHQEIKQLIISNSFGNINAFFCNYVRGIENYGTHIIDLIHFWFGEIEWVWATDKLKENFNDPSYDVFLFTKSGIGCHLIASNRNYFDLFDYTLIFDSRKIEFHREGFESWHYCLQKNTDYEELPIFRLESKIYHLSNIICTTIGQLLKCSNTNEEPLCNAYDGYYVLEVVSAIKKSIKSSKTEYVNSNPEYL